MRVRGEISQPSFPRSGHCYFRLKDENAVHRRGRLEGHDPAPRHRIEEGLEVIVTGKLTTYAGSSRYQIIIDRLELAGDGALLKLLEDGASGCRPRACSIPTASGRCPPCPRWWAW